MPYGNIASILQGAGQRGQPPDIQQALANMRMQLYGMPQQGSGGVGQLNPQQQAGVNDWLSAVGPPSAAGGGAMQPQRQMPAWQQLAQMGIGGQGSAAGNRAALQAAQLGQAGGQLGPGGVLPTGEPGTGGVDGRGGQVIPGIPGDPNTYTRQPDGSVIGTAIGRLDGGGYGPSVGVGSGPNGPVDLPTLIGGTPGRGGWGVPLPTTLTPANPRGPVPVNGGGLQGPPGTTGPPSPEALARARQSGFQQADDMPSVPPGFGELPMTTPGSPPQFQPAAPTLPAAPATPTAKPAQAQGAAQPQPSPAALGADGFKGPNAQRIVNARQDIYGNVQNALRRRAIGYAAGAGG